MKLVLFIKVLSSKHGGVNQYKDKPGNVGGVKQKYWGLNIIQPIKMVIWLLIVQITVWW